MEKNVIQVNSGLMINIDENLKKHHSCEKNMFAILLHVLTKMGNI